MARTTLFDCGEDQYYLPDLKTRLPLRQHSGVARTLGETRAWIKGFPEIRNWAPFCAPRGDIDLWLAQGFADVWISHQFTCGNLDTFRIICDLGGWMVMTDDVHSAPGPFRDADEATRNRALDRAIEILNGDGQEFDRNQPSSDTADVLVLGRCLSDVWYRLCRLAPPSIRARIARALQGTMEAWKAEASDRGSGRCLTLDEFLERRDVNVGIDVDFPILELMLEVDLHSELEAHADAFSTIWRILRRYTSLVNDLYSFRKEYMAGKDLTNSIAAQCNTEHVRISDAVRKVVDLAESAEEEFIACREQFIATHPELTSGLLRYLECLGDIASGTAFYTRCSPRYHGVDHDWSEIGGGLVTIDTERTIIHPRAEDTTQ
ncbi:terpene synthase family protein [Saccharopolyspora shandongensis]|uniref:terpene synthase family protein n=1 Tax=Saccharopolyspora shandongensis TaxID=418495 RepID=UPI00343E7A48